MTQLFNLSINGVLKKPTKINISEEMNRMYDVASFSLNEEPTHELEVIIHYGAKTFTGFVFSTRKTGKEMWSVECRTNGAKLTEPYSAYTDGFDQATTSHSLCALYASQSGISITNTAGDLDFGGSYERKGTMLSALTNIAARTGAEFWDDGAGIQIQPGKAITENGADIPPSDIFNFVASKSTVFNKGVGFITIRNGGSESSDIISKNKVYAEIDECTGEIFVYPNPNGSVEHTKGLSPLTAVVADRFETSSILEQDVIMLDGSIESIESVTLNGIDLTDYNFEQGHNVLYFSNLKRGTLTVKYKAYAYKGAVNVTEVPIGRFITFDIFYLDQLLRFEGLLSKECNSGNTDGDMTCIMPSNTYYNQGFDFHTIGGDPEFVFYNNASVILRTVTSVPVNYVSVENATLETVVGGYRYKPTYAIGTVLGVQANETDIAYTVSGGYIHFTQYYPDVVVSYETPATKHHVQFTKIENGNVLMVIRNKNTDEVCEYDLEDKIPCVLNQDITVDIAGELAMEVGEVMNVSLPYTTPTGSSTVSVDVFGKVKIWVDTDGRYVIDTSVLKQRTSITLIANVNG